MIEGAFAPVALSLAAAAAWGAGDFSGGVASRRSSALAVAIWAEGIGLALLVVVAILRQEPALAASNWLLAGLAGVCGGGGLVLLYQALATGRMAIAAPVSAVLAATVPVLVSAVSIGFPGTLTMAGLLLALAAISLISQSGGDSRTNFGFNLAELRLPFIAGLAFGLYFVLIHRASVNAIYWPLIATRSASVIFLCGFARITHQPWIPDQSAWGLSALCGLLDTSANWLYVLAGQIGRLDVAATLGSLYPGFTALLAWVILKERLSRTQLVGVLLAFVAIGLITL